MSERFSIKSSEFADLLVRTWNVIDQGGFDHLVNDFAFSDQQVFPLRDGITLIEHDYIDQNMASYRTIKEGI